MGPTDMSGGTGGTEAPRYPEYWKRERMLWFVHEWIQENQAGENRPRQKPRNARAERGMAERLSEAKKPKTSELAANPRSWHPSHPSRSSLERGR